MNIPHIPPMKSSKLGEDGFLQVLDVSKQFGKVTVVDKVSLSIRRQEFFALLGSSGCGKSTLLRIMAGLETPTSGRIVLDGQDITDIPAHRRPVNMMFQSYALFPHMDVASNVGYGLRREGVAKAQIRERVDEALALVQMGGYAASMPAQLSGGQQQRVALARSLVKRPKLLLLDEPMSALDKKIRQQTQFELGSILQKVGVTCLMVTHDQEEAMTMADRLAVMSEGVIVQMGTPEHVYEAPNTRFSAEFIGSTNVFTGMLASDGGDVLDCHELVRPLQLPHALVHARKGQSVTVSVRPERIRLSWPQGADSRDDSQVFNTAKGVVEQIGYMGSYTLYYLRLPSGRVLMAHVPREVLAGFGREPDYGDTVALHWSVRSLVVVG
jgi:putrescine transport system ATP-binding protein